MLSELHIENLAVIENSTVNLEDNLNIFTGETGAGKSILIGGINAVLGQRIYKDIIRAGAERAYVSAVFTDIPKAVEDKLSELGLESDGELIISREIRSDGKSLAKINSRPANVSALKEIGDMLVNIHGQHDSQILLNPAKHLDILDSYALSDKLLSDYQDSFKELQRTAREINRIKNDVRQNEQRKAYLSRIIEDVGSLGITENEDKAVEERFKVLDNAVSLSQALKTAVSCLTGDDDGEGASDLVAKAFTGLKVNEDILKELDPAAKRLGSVQIEIDDISAELSHILLSLDIDENEYEELTQRRNQLNMLKKRYGPELSDVIGIYEKSLEEIRALEDSGELIEELEKKKARLLLEVTKKAERLSHFRQEASLRFVSEVGAELAFLNMPDVRLSVSNQKGKLTLSGMDNIEFLISANKGETPKPLAKIASGGELSRIMLALKSVLADKDSIPTLIFDEIDSGVSGRAAHKIGIKLKEISKKHQVICVTHLPQIAVMADNHMLIEKKTENGRTVTEIKPLSFDERVREIARFLGGENITETVLKDAEEQLKSAMEV